MENPLRKTGSLVLLVLALLLSTWGTTAFAQKSPVVLSVNDKNVAPNTPVTITVTTSLSGTIKVDYPLELALDYGLMNGMEQKMDPSTGKIKTYYYIQQTGYFRKQGTYSFYAWVRYKGRLVKSNQLTITVKDDAEDDEDLGFNSKDPIFGVIQTKKTSVYEGEPLLLKAKVYSKLDIFFLEGYSPFKADKNAEEHVFQNERYEVEQTRYKGKDILTFEYGKQLLFPITTGKCKIQPFEMSLKCRGTFFDKTVTFRSSSAVITIKPLPSGAPADFIGAVGIYDLSQQLGKTKIRQGDVFTLTLVVHGLGNLHNSNAPILNLPAGCAIYGDPERKEDFVFTDEGVEGTITYRYNIQVTKNGSIAFPAPSISYFNPVSAEYVTVQTDGFVLDVEKNPAFHPIADSTQPKVMPSDLSVKGGSKDKSGGSRNTALLVVGIVSPVCLLGFLFFFFIRRKNGKTGKGKPVAGRPANPVVATAAAAPVDYWKAAVEAVNDAGLFSVLLPKGIIGQLEKKLNRSGLTREKTLSLLSDKYESQAAELREIIGVCDHHRYGFEDQQLDTHDLLSRTKAILDSIR